MKKKYLKANFLADVKKEINRLKKTATKEEIANLNIETFNPTRRTECIYGQMTGECTSKRAYDLMDSCCKRFIDYGETTAIQENGFSLISKNVNGVKRPGTRTWSFSWLSSLEAYIALPKAKNKNVIDYLKGETNTLTL